MWPVTGKGPDFKSEDGNQVHSLPCSGTRAATSYFSLSFHFIDLLTDLLKIGKERVPRSES